MKHLDRVRVLALLFGTYQAVHIVVNGRYMFGQAARAFPAPDDGWDEQTVDWARGMAIVDFVIAVLSVIFVGGVLRNRRWSTPLGLVTASVFTAAAAMFTIGAAWIGAFGNNPVFYSFIVLTGIPGFLLLGELFGRVSRAAVVS